MKTLRHLLLLAAGLAATAALIAAPEPTAPAAPGVTNVNVPAAVSELASGYASAVSQMTLKGLTIFYRADGKVIAIKGIRSARALGGVVFITFTAGDTMAINAEQIVMITDGARTPQG